MGQRNRRALRYGRYRRDDAAPALIAYRVDPRLDMRLTRAPSSRPWMAATTANRCLPLLIANQAGWLIRLKHALRVTWTGDADPSTSLIIEYLQGSPPYPACSHFGHGILSWTIPYLFRTPPGFNLLVRGPANWPKDGASPLEGIVETDWSMATFTMNWKLTRPNLPVTFDLDEPICMVVPQRRRELEGFRPSIRNVETEPQTAIAYRLWLASRRRFLFDLAASKPDAGRIPWQKHYFRGTSPGGIHAPEHQTKLNLREFDDGRAGEAEKES